MEQEKKDAVAAELEIGGGEIAKADQIPRPTAEEEESAEPQPASPQESDPAEATAEDGLKWYILQSYSNFERQVVEAIKIHAKQGGLEDEFGEMIIPTEQVVEVRRGKRVKSERKIFPGYVLVKMRMNAATHNLVKNLSKVMGFLGYDSAEMPSPVSDVEIASVINQVKEGLTTAKPSITFEVGEQVRVSEGPFASFNGLVEEVDEDKARLKVTVSIFGRSTPVELNYAQVEKV